MLRGMSVPAKQTSKPPGGRTSTRCWCSTFFLFEYERRILSIVSHAQTDRILYHPSTSNAQQRKPHYRPLPARFHPHRRRSVYITGANPPVHSHWHRRRRHGKQNATAPLVVLEGIGSRRRILRAHSAIHDSGESQVNNSWTPYVLPVGLPNDVLPQHHRPHRWSRCLFLDIFSVMPIILEPIIEGFVSFSIISRLGNGMETVSIVFLKSDFCYRLGRGLDRESPTKTWEAAPVHVMHNPSNNITVSLYCRY